VLKYRNCDATLVCKVTDDRQCITFQTSEASDLRLVEKLSLWVATDAAAAATASTAVSAETAEAERERKRVRAEENARKRAEKSSTKSVSGLEKGAGKTLAARRRGEAKRSKLAVKWAARQERKLLKAATSAVAAASGKTAVGDSK